jgi:GcrA cell cycle regulator
MSWTDERVERLKTLWSEGLSASQIAAELGSVTRNAVIGKVHRLGLSGRAKPQAQAARPAQAPRLKPSAPARPVQAPPPRPAARPITIGNVVVKPVDAPQTEIAVATSVEVKPITFEKMTILNLTEQTCKWPIGDPGRPDFFFCGRRSDSGIPYCAYHARIAYQPSAERKARDRRAAG